MKPNSALLDTSFLITLFVDTGVSEENVKDYIMVLGRFEDLYITNFIYAEFATVVSQRIGKDFFKQTEKELTNLGLKEIFIDKSLELRVREDYKHLTKKDISYVDLLTTFVAKENNLYIVTLDKHFLYLKKRYGIYLYENFKSN